MSDRLAALLAWLLDLPEPLLHLFLGFLAALENVVPPLPSDVIILFGGFLAGQGATSVWTVFLVVWAGNVAGALLVYALGRMYGSRFFAGRWGQLLLKPRQLASLGWFYHRYGFGVIFVSRFIPVFRSVVPVFAGVSHVGFFRTTIPLALASGIWYGLLVNLGAAAGENWDRIVDALEAGGRWLYLATAVLLVALFFWWYRSRGDGEEMEQP